MTREAIVQGAVRLIDAEGYASFSVRGLAAALGISPATVHHHVGSRGDVLLAVVDSILSEVPLTDPSLLGDWRDSLRMTAVGYRETLRRHPRCAALVVETGPRSSVGRLLNVRVLAAMSRGGVPTEQLLDVHAAVISYVLGSCLQHTGQSLTGLPMPDFLACVEELPADADTSDFLELLPRLFAPLRVADDDGDQASFDAGLDALLEGLALRMGLVTSR